MTFQLSASVAVNGFRLSAPRTATRRLPPVGTEPSALTRLGRAAETTNRRASPRMTATASLRITGHPLQVGEVLPRTRCPLPSSCRPSSFRHLTSAGTIATHAGRTDCEPDEQRDDREHGQE